jgi:hypothetical protein
MAQLSWKVLVELVGMAAIVASLIFVGYQLQQDRRLAGAQVIVAADAVELEMSSLISQNSDVWLKGLRGEELTAVEEVTFRAIAAAHYRKHLGMYLRVQLLGFGTGDMQAENYAFDLYQYPLLRQIFVENMRLTDSRTDYLSATATNQFRDEVKDYLSVFDASPAEIGERLYFAH